MTSAKDKVYFPGINALRFFAASGVVITHIELMKGQMSMKNNWKEPFFLHLGSLGVFFFFVLSGFLITYLLLKEKEKTGRVAIKEFYVRRILRIWPLYYLVIVLAFFVFPHLDILRNDWFDRFMDQDFGTKLMLYLLMLPNLGLAMFPSVPYAGQTWSIGVEEQFYLIWPAVVGFAKKTGRLLLLFFAGVILFKVIFLLYYKYASPSHTLTAIKDFIAMTKIELMAMGGIGAWLFYKNKTVFLNLIFSLPVQILSYVLIPVLLYLTPQSVQDAVHLLYGALFLVIIMNVALNPHSIFKFNNRVFDFLGTISYGIYMYHMFIIVIVVRLSSRWFEHPGSVTANVAYYILTFVSVIFVAALSYYLFERRFIRMKKKHTVIPSGNTE
ncbi:MAG: acyltransferase [Bacteroidia bacterium]